MISNDLKAKIHIAKQQLALSDDLYRDILYSLFKVESCIDLTPRQADELLKHFKSLGWKSKRKKRRRVHAPHELPTPDQLRHLQYLYGELGWTDPRRQMGFNERMCGKPWPQDRAEVNRIIEALKKMKVRGYSERVPKKEER